MELSRRTFSALTGTAVPPRVRPSEPAIAASGRPAVADPKLGWSISPGKKLTGPSVRPSAPRIVLDATSYNIRSTQRWVMLAVFLAKVPGRGAGAGRCAAIWGASVVFHVVFAAGAVSRIDQARADVAVQVLFTATVVAYVVVLVLATRAIKAGERAGPS